MTTPSRELRAWLTAYNTNRKRGAQLQVLEDLTLDPRHQVFWCGTQARRPVQRYLLCDCCMREDQVITGSYACSYRELVRHRRLVEQRISPMVPVHNTLPENILGLVRTLRTGRFLGSWTSDSFSVDDLVMATFTDRPALTRVLESLVRERLLTWSADDRIFAGPEL